MKVGILKIITDVLQHICIFMVVRMACTAIFLWQLFLVGYTSTPILTWILDLVTSMLNCR